MINEEGVFGALSGGRSASGVVTSGRDVAILFGRKFCEFGADLGNALVEKGVCEKVSGICIGGERVVRRVRSRLGVNSALIWSLEPEEEGWVNKSYRPELYRRLEDELGPAIVGLTIVSDRRIGAGFVLGGEVRPSRLLDRVRHDPVSIPARYVAGLYSFLDRFLTEANPSFAFLYAVAGAPAFLLSQMCKARGIPVLRPVSARIGARTLIDIDPLGRFHHVAKVQTMAKAGEINLDSEREEAREYIENFRKRPSKPDYVKMNERARMRNTLSRLALSASKGTLRAFLEWDQARRAHLREQAARRWFDFHMRWRCKLMRHSVFATDIEPSMNFVYFPLHVEPEASTMVLSPWHTNQLAVVEALAKAIPGDACLVVKENAAMVGRRPKGFYENIGRIPRVVLAHPKIDSHSLIKRGALTAVITGTAAWEALILRKPALVVGDSPFLNIGEGIYYEPSLEKLGGAVRRALSQPVASDKALEDFVAAMLYVSFEMDARLLWGNYMGFSEADRSRAVQKFVSGISSCLGLMGFVSNI